VEIACRHWNEQSICSKRYLNRIQPKGGSGVHNDNVVAVRREAVAGISEGHPEISLTFGELLHHLKTTFRQVRVRGNDVDVLPVGLPNDAIEVRHLADHDRGCGVVDVDVQGSLAGQTALAVFY